VTDDVFDVSDRTLLIVDDEKNIRFSLRERFKSDYDAVHAVSNGTDALDTLDREPVDLVLLDQNLKESGENGLDVLRRIKERHPHVVVIIMTAFGRFEQAMEAARLDCYQYLSKPLDLDQLDLVMRNGLSAAALRGEVVRLRKSQRSQYKVDLVMGKNARMVEVVKLTERVAATSSIVLIQGETGVGKELIARTVHYHSPRGHGPFVEVNCSAIPENLIESELFGHEKGAFTDARRAKAGLFEVADGGTLFLDEIGELSLALQSRLLRVLESDTIRPVGATSDRKVDVRVVSATHRDLADMVRKGEFREDLYYRLSVLPVEVPPLRERPEDIPDLVTHFVRRYGSEFHVRVERIAPDAMEALTRYAWPGNVRELRNVVERALLMLDGEVIRPEHLPPNVRGETEAPRLRVEGPSSDPAGDAGAPPVPEEEPLFAPGNVPTLVELERWGIERAMAMTGNNKTRAADLLGISRQTLRMKLKDAASGEDDAASVSH